MNSEAPGTVVHVRIEARNGLTGALTDPTSLEVVTSQPGEPDETYEYLTDPELTRLSTGVYNFDLVVPSTGPHISYRAVATGAVAATARGTILIDRS